jgi:predicted amidophosphoribosyltransferase
MGPDTTPDTPASFDTTAPSSGSKFVWPPAPLPADDGLPLDTRPASEIDGARDARPAGWRTWLRDAETFWLAPTSLPLARRREACAWSPDPLSAFCNRCAQSVGFSEDDEFGCAKCRDRRFAWSRAVRLGEFEGDLASWVKEVKFAKNASLACDLGRLLGERVRDAGLPGERVCVVPIPMSRIERWTKGFDHARAIAEGVARSIPGGLAGGRSGGEAGGWSGGRAPLVRGLVREHRPSQRSMTSVSARERNVKRAFRAARGVDLSGWTVVLVDDVMTTGATMRAASRALWPRLRASRPAAIWVAAVGVTPDRQAGVAASSDQPPGEVV